MDFERRLADMDWRLVDAFDLQHIDTVLLQEMVPSVTYGLVTEAMCASPRLACKLICILQLMLEMFIGCRKHDAYDVQLLQDDLSSALRDRDAYRLRLKEALTDTKALKVQLARTTTLLKSCGHVLHAHGCSPHAIAALEALLATPLTASADAAVKVAHLCAFCGKAFGTQDYLLKHLERRHPGGTVDAASPEAEDPAVVYAKPATTRIKPSLPDYQAVLSKLETMLSQHEVSIRAVAADETAKLKAMQTEMHLESGIKTELHVARAAVNARLDDAQRHLAQVLEEREDAMKQLLDLKDEIALLRQKQAMQPPPPTRIDAVVPDVKDRLTIERLEAIVGHSKDALALARDDLKTTHDKYADLLVTHERTKFELAAVQKDLHDARQPPMPVPTASVMCQTNTAADTKDAVAQTILVVDAPPPKAQVIEAAAEPEPVHHIPPVPTPPSPVEVAHTSVQTDTMVDQAPLVPQAAFEPKPVKVVPEPVASEPTPRPSARLPPELLAVHIEDVLAQIMARAERPSAMTFNIASEHVLARRPFLKSAWPHAATAVETRMKQHLETLDHMCERYGVSRVATKLSSSQHALATTALKAHLHAMPVTVLQKMVAVDTTAEALVTSEWLPNEASRQTALAAIQMRMDEQDATQTHWVQRILEKKTAPDDPPATTTTLTKVLRRPPPVDMAASETNAPPTTHNVQEAIQASAANHAPTAAALGSVLKDSEGVSVSMAPRERRSVTTAVSVVTREQAPALIQSRASPLESRNVEAASFAMPVPRTAHPTPELPVHPELDAGRTTAITEAPSTVAPKAAHVISVGHKATPHRDEEVEEARSVELITSPLNAAELPNPRDEAPSTESFRREADETAAIASLAASRCSSDAVDEAPFVVDNLRTKGVLGDDHEAFREAKQHARAIDVDDDEDRSHLQDVGRLPTEDAPAQQMDKEEAPKRPLSPQDGGVTGRYSLATADDAHDDDIQELDISDSMVSQQPRMSVLSDCAGDVSGDEDEPEIPSIEVDAPLIDQHPMANAASPKAVKRDADAEDEAHPAPDLGGVSTTSADDAQTGSGSGHDETPTASMIEAPSRTLRASSVFSSIESIPDESAVESSVLESSVLESSVLEGTVVDTSFVEESVESFAATDPAVLRGRDMDDDPFARPKTAPRMSLRDSLLHTQQSAPSRSFSRPSINRWGSDDDDDVNLPDATPLQSLRHNGTMDDDLEEEELA